MMRPCMNDRIGILNPTVSGRVCNPFATRAPRGRGLGNSTTGLHKIVRPDLVEGQFSPPLKMVLR